MAAEIRSWIKIGANPRLPTNTWKDRYTSKYRIQYLLSASLDLIQGRSNHFNLNNITANINILPSLVNVAFLSISRRISKICLSVRAGAIFLINATMIFSVLPSSLAS